MKKRATRILLTPLDEYGAPKGEPVSMEDVEIEFNDLYVEDRPKPVARQPRYWVNGEPVEDFRIALLSDAGSPSTSPALEVPQAVTETPTTQQSVSPFVRTGPDLVQRWPNRNVPLLRGMTFDWAWKGTISIAVMRIMIGEWGWKNWYMAELTDQMRWEDDGGPALVDTNGGD